MDGLREGTVDDRLRRALREVARDAVAATASAAEWPTARRRATIAALDEAVAALTTARSALLLAEKESGAWRSTGDPSFAAWRGRTSREGRRAAVVEERRAETLGAMPGVRDAAVNGEVSLEHVDVLGKVAAQASPAVRAALESPEEQERVLDMARRVDAGRFARALDAWAAANDAAQLERAHRAERAERFLHVVDAPDGTRIKGRLDRMAGHRLRLALEALSPRPAADDERSPEQRRADALDALAEKVLSLPDTTSGAAVRPHVSFVMSEETWAYLRATRGAPTEASAPVPPVTLEDGTPVPPSEVARALCDCELTRIVVDAQSEPINLGRTARTYTGVQRRAVIARDRGCGWDGCEMPPRWCEVHHMTWWDRDGGETAVAEGVLVCSYHHHLIHRLDLTVRRHALDADEARATGRTVGYVFTTRDGTVVSGRRTSSRRTEPGPARSRPETATTALVTTTRPGGRAPTTRPGGRAPSTRPGAPPATRTAEPLFEPLVDGVP